MPHAPISYQTPTNELRKVGTVVGRTDRVYAVSGPRVHFDEIIVLGDLSGELEYNNHRLQIVAVNTIIGLEVTMQGARGPVWRGVECRVL